jgi:hypothetical protein
MNQPLKDIGNGAMRGLGIVGSFVMLALTLAVMGGLIALLCHIFNSGWGFVEHIWK